MGRWEKVYERLLLLNAEHPMKVGRCSPVKNKGNDKDHKRVIKVGIEEGAIFLGEPDETPVLLMSDKPIDLKPLIPTKMEAIGELLPARTELRNKQGDLVAVVFEAVACHSYTTHPDAKNYRIGSLDLLIEIYFAMYFAEITEYKEGRLLCLIRDLIER